MRWTALVLVIVAAVGIVLAVVWPRVSGTRAEFAAPAEALLRRLAPGSDPDVREVAGEVYDQASATFREALIRDRFVDRVLQLNVTMGAFRTVRAVVAEETFKSQAGDVVRVDLDLEFDKGRTNGSVAYVRSKPDQPFRLLGIEVVVPEARLAFANTVVPAYVSIRSPPVVLDKMTSILKQIDAGKETSVYQQATAAFRDSVNHREFSVRVRDDRNALGRFRRVLSPLSTGISMDQTRIRIYALVEYDRARAPVTIEFQRGPDLRRDQPEYFYLLSYRVVVPQPPQSIRSPEVLRPQ